MSVTVPPLAARPVSTVARVATPSFRMLRLFSDASGRGGDRCGGASDWAVGMLEPAVSSLCRGVAFSGFRSARAPPRSRAASLRRGGRLRFPPSHGRRGRGVGRPASGTRVAEHFSLVPLLLLPPALWGAGVWGEKGAGHGLQPDWSTGHADLPYPLRFKIKNLDGRPQASRLRRAPRWRAV